MLKPNWLNPHPRYTMYSCDAIFVWPLYLIRGYCQSTGRDTHFIWGWIALELNRHTQTIIFERSQHASHDRNPNCQAGNDCWNFRGIRPMQIQIHFWKIGFQNWSRDESFMKKWFCQVFDTCALADEISRKTKIS